MKLLVAGVAGLIAVAAGIIHRRTDRWDGSEGHDPSGPAEHAPRPGEPAYYDYLYKRFEHCRRGK